ncbi:acetate--CoA ligase family protein [Sporosarcina sp. P13]|uniref:acetate--CoA ligase family protein n=1 Tax=Sporosarcina sp. P13 TaxID=2048263 RepID=UPI0013040F89|nr:acetate--CoA ligase family protein [Sporosarcina sp. P13]
MKEQNLIMLSGSVRSIALVGANHRFATQIMLENLFHFGFEGEIFLVNPRYESLNGMKCYDSLLDIGKQIDMVAGLVNPQMMIDVTKQAVNVGAKVLFIPGGGYGESGLHGKAIEEIVLKEASKTGMRVIGPNCMGYVDLHNGFTPYIGTLNRPKRPIQKGQVSIISQSGSVLDAFVASRIGLSKIYSTGNEVELKMCNYISLLAKDPKTSVIILYIEAVRDHEEFLKALNLCAEYKKPVIAIKVGKTKKASAMANAHSGALAGDYKVEKLVLEEHGVIFVSDIDEAVATAQLFSQPYAPTNNTVYSFAVSGGQAGMTLDLAGEYGVDFPEFSDVVKQEFKNKLPELIPLSNPLDTWGKSSKEFSEVSKICLEALATGSDAGIIAVAIDAPDGQGDHEFDFTGTPARCLAALREKTDKPLVYFSHIQEDFDPRVLAILDEAGIPAIRGSRNALVACRAMFQYRDFLEKKEQSPIYSVNKKVFEYQPTLLDDDDGRKLLQQYGFHAPTEKVVNTLQESIQTSEEIGYPVVLKAQGLAHKSDVGGVALNLRNAEELTKAWNSMQKLNSPYYLIQEMIHDGFETILSYKTDAHYGPVVIFGIGGIYTEMIKEVVVAIPPISQEKAKEMIREIPMLWKSIQGYRGKETLDFEGLVNAIVKMGEMAESNYEEIVEFEINPLIVRSTGAGVKALDVLASVRKTINEEISV